MPSLDTVLTLLSQKIDQKPWLSNYKNRLTSMIQKHNKPDELMSVLSSFFDAFSEPALEPFRKIYITYLLHSEYEIIDLVMAYATIGRHIKDNRFLLSQQKNLNQLASVLHASENPLQLTIGIIKISDAAPFLDYENNNKKGKENLTKLIQYAELWFGNTFLKEQFDDFHNYKLTQKLFDKLIALSNEKSLGTQQVRTNIASCLLVNSQPKKESLWSWPFTFLNLSQNRRRTATETTEEIISQSTDRKSFG